MSVKSSENTLNEILSEGGSIYWSPGFPNVEPNSIVEENVLIVPLFEEIFLPFMHIGSVISDSDAKAVIRRAYSDSQNVFFCVVKDNLPDGPITKDHLIDVEGAFGRVENIQENPDGTLSVEIDMKAQGKIIEVTENVPFSRGNISVIIPEPINPNKEEFEREEKLERVYDDMKKFLSESDRDQLNSMLAHVAPRTVRRLNFMIQNSPVSPEMRYELMCINSLSERRDALIELLENQKKSLEFKSQIGQKVMMDMGQRQREDFLRAQIQQIKNELGESDESDIDELYERGEKMEWDETRMKRFNKEMRKLERFNPTTPDFAVQYSYIDTLLSLPWNKCDNSSFTLDSVENILNRDHYGLEKVKDRIIEQMAVMRLRKDTKAPILCFVGPPGVGKTSLGKSIADALGRKYVRVALGGLHDEAEIRGHRRTYLGAMPGRIINALIKCGTSDPVMVLDEIDKIGQDYKGDPEQALLEVLDPEQNCRFHDNFVDEDYDLSKVFFIATANSLQKVSSPLLDRMEIIEIGGYVEKEKIEIAQRHLISRDLVEYGFEKDEIIFSDEALMEIISSYTRESGVRRLEKKIKEVLRKIARLKASDKDYPRHIGVMEVKEFLGKPEAFNDRYEGNEIIGVVTGLAWTQAGGEILFIESSIAPGKDGKLVLTGNLGDVMKESAMLALQYIKSNYKQLGIPAESLEFGTVHIHVPEGAVPKDGPSAGVTILTSLVSSFTGRKVRPELAMTGEITLRGKVLPVGGIKEKILAAKRAGIKIILLSEKNRKDIEEIKSEYLDGLNFHYVENVAQVLDFSLIK